MSIHRHQLRENVVIQRVPRPLKRELWKVKAVHPSHFTAELVLPRPERPMVCEFMFGDLAMFQAAERHVLSEYEKAWGVPAET
jgi:hypothetical protein